MNLISVLIFILCLTMFATTQAFQRLAKQQGVSGVWSSTSRLMATDRTYVGYSIYKGKGALNVKPLPPTFNKVGKSGRGIEREGSLYLEFAPIGSKPREYNWASKVTFSLDVNECGGILAMDRSLGVEFLHDPNMGGKLLIDSARY